jgi:hypothetical protein
LGKLFVSQGAESDKRRFLSIAKQFKIGAY